MSGVEVNSHLESVAGDGGGKKEEGEEEGREKENRKENEGGEELKKKFKNQTVDWNAKAN